jgi:hypothetical protein
MMLVGEELPSVVRLFDLCNRLMSVEMPSVNIPFSLLGVQSDNHSEESGNLGPSAGSSIP